MRGILAAASILLLAAPVCAEPLIVENGRLFLQAKVNGITTEALLDSAAEASLIDPKLAEAAQLEGGQAISIRGSGGQASARLVEGATIQVLGLKVTPEAVVVTDLSEISNRLIKRPTQMVLGRELFDAARLTINISEGRIVRTATGVLPPGLRLALTAHAGVESIPVTVNGVTAQAEFDLGNGSDVLISRAMMEQLDLMPSGKKSGGGIGGELARHLVTLRRLEVGGMLFSNVVAAVDDQSNAGDLNIGTSILKHFVITTDFKQRSVWLKPLR